VNAISRLVVSLLLCALNISSVEAGVPLWTTPNGFAVGFNEPWIGDYRCDYYSAWLSKNYAFDMNQGVPDATATPTACNTAFVNKQVTLSLRSTTTGATLPTQLVKLSRDNNLPNNYLWGIRKANGSVVKFLLFSNLQGLLVSSPLTSASSPVPNPRHLASDFIANLDALLTQAHQMGLKVYVTVLNGGDMKSWANNSALPQMQGYFQNLIRDPVTKANFKLVLDDLLTVLNNHRGDVYAMDFVNEIEAPLNVGSIYFPDGWIGARAWIAEMVGYIKQKSNYLGFIFPITAAAGYNYAAQEITLGLFSGIGLDFFDLHEYTDSGQYPGQTALCNKVRNDQQQIILGEFGQKSKTYSDVIQNNATTAFLYGAARSCFSGALAWKFEGTSYSNPQLGYRTQASGPPPPPPVQEAPSTGSYPYRPAYCAIRMCGSADVANFHGAYCGANPEAGNCRVSSPWGP
jgi:hypothetical protein